VIKSSWKVSPLGGTVMNYISIDHDRQYLHVSLLDEGEVMKSGRVVNFCGNSSSDFKSAWT